MHGMLFKSGEELEDSFPPEWAYHFLTRETILVVSFPNDVNLRGVIFIEEFVQELHEQGLIASMNIQNTPSTLHFRLAYFVPGNKYWSSLLGSKSPPEAIHDVRVDFLTTVLGIIRVHMKNIGMLVKTDLIRASLSPVESRAEQPSSLLLRHLYLWWNTPHFGSITSRPCHGDCYYGMLEHLADKKWQDFQKGTNTPRFL